MSLVVTKAMSLKRSLAHPVLCSAVIVLACLASFAQEGSWTMGTNGGGARTVTWSGSRRIVPAARRNTKLKVIFSNLSDYKYGTYFCCTGEGIEGPETGFGTQWVAVPFTPTAAAKVKRVEAAIRWMSGSKSAAIWLASDNDDFPGPALSSIADVNILAEGGGCCQLAVARFKNVSVEQDKQYWVVVGTDSHSLTANLGWFYNTTDMRLFRTMSNRGNGWWHGQNPWIYPAVGVFGK